MKIIFDGLTSSTAQYLGREPDTKLEYTIGLVDPRGNPIEETDEGYVAVAHRQEYAIAFNRKAKYITDDSDSTLSRRVAADITINGEPLRRIVLPDTNGTATLKTKPGNNDGRFQALAVDSNRQARKIDAAQGEENAGLITVRLCLEKEVDRASMIHIDGYDHQFSGGSRYLSGSFGILSSNPTKSMGAAVSGFSNRHTGQSFGSTTFRPEEGTAQTVHLRLAIDPEKTRVMVPREKPEPNPPAPIGR